MTGVMNYFFKLFLFSMLILSSSASIAENFPKPAELERDVNFWVRVYTEIDT